MFSLGIAFTPPSSVHHSVNLFVLSATRLKLLMVCIVMKLHTHIGLVAFQYYKLIYK